MMFSFYILLCYTLLLVSAALIVITGIQGFHPTVFLGLHHPEWGMLCLLVVLFTKTCLIYFFVGLKRIIRDTLSLPENQHQNSEVIMKKILLIKSSASRYAYTTICLCIITFLLGAAVHTGRISTFWHRQFFFIFSAFFLVSLSIQHRKLKEGVFVLWDVLGIRKDIEKSLEERKKSLS